MKLSNVFAMLAAVFTCIFSAVPSSVYASADNGFTMEEIENSDVKPVITVESQCISLSEAQSERTRSINISISGADRKYAVSCLHIYFDKRLEIPKNEYNTLEVAQGYAISRLTAGDPTPDPLAVNYDMNGILLLFAGRDNYGIDGTMWTINFTLPDDVKEGDVFPIDIIFRSNSRTEDMFTNALDDSDGKLMSAYAFTKGIYNEDTNNNFTADSADIAECPSLAYIDKSYDGYIAVKGGSETSVGDVMCGDANGDGNVNMSDATAIIQHIGNKDRYGLKGTSLANADTNGDGQVTTADAIIIQELLAGIHKAEDLPIK